MRIAFARWRAQSLFFLFRLIVPEIPFNTLRAIRSAFLVEHAILLNLSFRSETAPTLHIWVDVEKSRAVPDLICSTCDKRRLVASIGYRWRLLWSRSGECGGERSRT